MGGEAFEGVVKRYRKGEVIPEGAVFLSRLEISRIQKKRLDTLRKENPLSVWPLTFGPYLTSIAAATCGFLFSTHYRGVFKLSSYPISSVMSTFTLPIVFPGVILLGAHQVGFVPELMRGDVRCKLCFETKLGVGQTVVGVLYPFLASWLSCTMAAQRLYTYDVPTASLGATTFFNFLRKTAPPSNLVLMLVMASMSGGLFLGEKMQQCYEESLMKQMENRPIHKQELDY